MRTNVRSRACLRFAFCSLLLISSQTLHTAAQVQMDTQSLTRELHLTEDQATHVTAIKAEALHEMHLLDLAPQGPDYAKKRSAIRDNSRNKIRALLTPQQRKRFDELVEAHRAQEH